MNIELMRFIQINCPMIEGVRNVQGHIQVKILKNDSEDSWIELHQAPSHVEKVIVKWLSLGGEI